MKTIISCYSLVQAHLTKKGLSYYITRLLYKGVNFLKSSLLLSFTGRIERLGIKRKKKKRKENVMK